MNPVIELIIFWETVTKSKGKRNRYAAFGKKKRKQMVVCV